MNSFHNTNNLKGSELNQAESAAKTQEVIIKDIFKEAESGLTASEVFKMFPSDKTPITSIRRGITNLCTQGTLHKTSSMKLGLYGKPEHVYKVIEQCISCKVGCICPNGGT